ncbi:hypothetical protein AB4Z50_09115 [Paenibacillus sp. 2TAB26]|uniref:hypothetical protein n=1 Tax=Paenibacillus sp. 2TAB26 TaxID=3233005 RepID=UPI003F9B21B9
MEKLWSLYEDILNKYGLVITDDIKIQFKEKLWGAAYEYHPQLVVWSNGKNDLLLDSIKTKELPFDLFLFTLMRFGNYHEQFIYARQVTAHRIVESFHSFLILLKEEKYSSLGGLLRMFLESIAMFEKALRKTQFNISKIEKSLSRAINQRGNSDTIDLGRNHLLEAQNHFTEFENDLNKIVTETYVDWKQYSLNGDLQEYQVKEGFFDPSPQMGYSETIIKMETKLKPHKGESWGMLYTFLCDFTHPSVGSRISGLDFNRSKIHKNGDLWTREMYFNSVSVENELLSSVTKDLVYFSYDLLKLYLDINKQFEGLYKRVKNSSQLLVRNTLFYKNKQNSKTYTMLKKRVNPYNKCICFGDSRFKFCCGNEENW